MAAVLDAKTIYAPAGNAIEVVDVIYDFADDAGATGDLDLFTAGEKLVLYGIVGVVETTFTSGGSATGALKKNSTAITNSVAVASLTSGAAVPLKITLSEGTPNTAVYEMPMVLVANDVIKFTIGTAAMTAGKAHFKFLVGKAY